MVLQTEKPAWVRPISPREMWLPRHNSPETLHSAVNTMFPNAKKITWPCLARLRLTTHPTMNGWGLGLVEPAGIEPASASPLQAVLHT